MIRLALVTAVWSALTIGALEQLPRLVPIGPELVGGAHVGDWAISLLGTGSATVDDGVLRLDAGACPDPGERGCGGSAVMLGAPAGAHWMVLAGEVRWTGVSGADGPGLARIEHPVVLEDGETSWSFAHGFAGGAVSGDSPWTRYEHDFLVDPDARSVQVLAQLVGTHGTLEARNLSLRAARPATAWLLVALGLGAGWLAIGAATARQVARGADRRWAGALTLLLALGWLPLLLAPEGFGVIVARSVAHALADPPAPPVPVPAPAPAAVSPVEAAPPAAPIAASPPAAAAPAPAAPVDDHPVRHAIRAALSDFDDDDVHVWMFLLLGWSAGWVRRRPHLAVPVGLALFGVATEALQSFTFDRGISFGDWTYDLIGATVGLATARLGGGGRAERR